MPFNVEQLRIKIFMDGAKIDDFKTFNKFPYIKGFTTNPSLMRKAGVSDYEAFIKEVIPLTNGKPLSLEVISDDFELMAKQAEKLSSFAENIYVKIPITNTDGISSVPLVVKLIAKKIKVNITAIMTIKQIEGLVGCFDRELPVILSIFAGRIADTGVDPTYTIRQSRKILKDFKNVELLWASPRELLNIFQAEEAGCDIITIVPEILSKINLIGYDLDKLSLDTVKMFYNDAVSSGLKI